MKKLFDPCTYKLYDVTTGEELIYRKDHKEISNYDPLDVETYYQIDPTQEILTTYSVDILSPSLLADILSQVTHQDFATGFNIGFSDGFFKGTREYYTKPTCTSWSFLVGYEYGVQYACFYKFFRRNE